MGIRSGLGNMISGIKTAATNTISEIGAGITSIFDAAVTKIGSIYSGGFIGIDANNWGTIKEAIEKLITDAETELNKFNELAERDDALKGQAAGALGEYLKKSKELLLAYATTYRNFITDAETALTAMNEGDTANAQSIQEAASAIEQKANEIRVD